MFVFPGFNSNIEHRNKKFHIQTEVNAVEGINKINTLIYLAGRIFLSFSNELGKDDSVNRETATVAIRRQHNRVIRDLISDQLESKNDSPATGEIDFSGLYGNNEIFTCYGKCFNKAADAYKKLLLTEEN